MNQTANYKGRCFCGAVQFTVTNEPELAAYCHCDSCRHWSAGPVNALTLWAPDNFKVTQGADNIGAYDKTAATTNEAGMSNRKWCKTCGGHVFIDHPGMGLVDVPAALVEGFAFSPTFHVHYQESVHPMHDGLPKFKDLPEAAGGSGEEIPE